MHLFSLMFSNKLILVVNIGYLADFGGVIDYSNMLREYVDSSIVCMLEFFIFVFYLECVFNQSICIGLNFDFDL